jgi:hypothetical protein
LVVAAVISAASISACKDEPVPSKAPVATEKAEAADLARQMLQDGQRIEALRPNTSPHAAVAAKVQPSAPAELGDLRKFSGFSGDESRYAFSVFSEGAGFHLLHVVNAAGEMLQRFQLPDDAHVEKARDWLRAQGFSPRSGELPGKVRERLKATVRDGKVRVTGTPAAGGEAKVLYQADPFSAQGGVGKPSSAEFAQVAPSGKRVAVKVGQAAVTEFGGITTYVIVDVTPVLEGAK